MNRKISFTIFVLLLSIPFSGVVYSQAFDCTTQLKIRQAKPPYQFNDLSKSAVCKTGEKYEYNIELKKGKEYRLTFFASSVFNNKINFRIINKSTGEQIMNLPGVKIDDVQGCVLEAYFDDQANRRVHPYFDFLPDNDTPLKIIIEVESEKSNYEYDTQSLLAKDDQKKGCVTVYVQSKLAEEEGFSN